MSRYLSLFDFILVSADDISVLNSESLEFLLTNLYLVLAILKSSVVMADGVREKPKSQRANFTSALIRILAGFISLWTISYALQC